MEKSLITGVVVLGLNLLWITNGKTILNKKINIICNNILIIIIELYLHGLGSIVMIWFIVDQWNYMCIWYLFSLFILLPFILEIFS